MRQRHIGTLLLSTRNRRKPVHKTFHTPICYIRVVTLRSNFPVRRRPGTVFVIRRQRSVVNIRRNCVSSGWPLLGRRSQ